MGREQLSTCWPLVVAAQTATLRHAARKAAHVPNSIRASPAPASLSLALLAAATTTATSLRERHLQLRHRIEMRHPVRRAAVSGRMRRRQHHPAARMRQRNVHVRQRSSCDFSCHSRPVTSAAAALGMRRHLRQRQLHVRARRELRVRLPVRPCHVQCAGDNERCDGQCANGSCTLRRAQLRVTSPATITTARRAAPPARAACSRVPTAARASRVACSAAAPRANRRSARAGSRPRAARPAPSEPAEMRTI